MVFACNAYNQEYKDDEAKLDSASKLSDLKLPFIGKKSFDTRPAFSGIGTPHRYIEIDNKGDVYFSFEQENQADGNVTNEKYYSGKFKNNVVSIFKKLDNETIYYTVTKDSIYEIDANNRPVYSQDCCSPDNLSNTQECPCKSALY